MDRGCGKSTESRGRRRQKLARRLGVRLIPVLGMLLLGSVAGCGGGGGGNAPARAKSQPGPASNSSVIAVDCMTQRAYVPLPDLNDNLHGAVAVLDLSVDPDVANPLITVIDTGEVALPRSAAVHLESGTVLVLMDNVLDTGVLLLINEADNSISTVPFPAGSRP